MVATSPVRGKGVDTTVGLTALQIPFTADETNKFQIKPASTIETENLINPHKGKIVHVRYEEYNPESGKIEVKTTSARTLRTVSTDRNPDTGIYKVTFGFTKPGDNNALQYLVLAVSNDGSIVERENPRLLGIKVLNQPH